MIKFSFIIVSWNVRDYLEECLRSLEDQIDDECEVIAVDNNSTDSTAQMFEQRKWVQAILSKENLGFARANNLGARSATGEYFVFINPDTKAQADFILRLKRFCEEHPQIAFFGGKLKNTDLSVQLSTRRLPRLSDQVFRSLKLHRIFPNARVWTNYICRDFDYDKMSRVEQIMGAFMVIRKEVFLELKGFRENYFLWFEEVDLCRRALQNGIQVWYAPDVELIHYGGQSFSRLGPKKQIFFTSSLIKYFWFNGDFISASIIALVFPINICLTYLGALFSNHR